MTKGRPPQNITYRCARCHRVIVRYPWVPPPTICWACEDALRTMIQRNIDLETSKYTNDEVFAERSHILAQLEQAEQRAEQAEAEVTRLRAELARQQRVMGEAKP